jgi:hypothetical protein
MITLHDPDQNHRYERSEMMTDQLTPIDKQTDRIQVVIIFAPSKNFVVYYFRIIIIILYNFCHSVNGNVCILSGRVCHPCLPLN